MKISASIYSSSVGELEERVLALDRLGVDAFHLDCAGDLHVFEDVARIRRVSRTPLDLHVISADPGPYIPLIVQHRIEFACFQFEDLQTLPQLPGRDVCCTEFGLAVRVATPLRSLSECAPDYQYLMLMTTVPGQSGGTFDDQALQRVSEIRDRFPGMSVRVDGGVDSESAARLRSLAVDWAVSGSYLMGADSTPAALLRLRTCLESEHEAVSTFMRHLGELPRIGCAQARQAEYILSEMEAHRQGFCVVLDHEGKLAAVVSDGDVRRAALDSLTQHKPIEAEALLNRSPLAVHQDTTLQQLFTLIQRQARPLSFVPVNDNDGRLVGCISFNDLMRGVG